MIKNILTLAILLTTCTISQADLKKVNGTLYGNVCRNGNVFSVRFDPEYWAPVRSQCNVLRLDGTVFSLGYITYE